MIPDSCLGGPKPTDFIGVISYKSMDSCQRLVPKIPGTAARDFAAAERSLACMGLFYICLMIVGLKAVVGLATLSKEGLL